MRVVVFAFVRWCVGALVAGDSVYADQHFESGATKVSVIELYTSEGCSSCPPAERWLSEQRNNPDLWKTFVPVAFHVTYWDRLGWPDRFAQRAFTERQYAYAAMWRSDSVYTPCFVRDGLEWKSRHLARETSEAPGQLALTVDGSGKTTVRFSPVSSPTEPLVAWVALLSSEIDSNVERGENAGRKLRHDFTVVELTNARLASQGTETDLVATITLHPEAPAKLPAPAIAAWITVGEKPGGVIQATGGWLVTSAR